VSVIVSVPYRSDAISGGFDGADEISLSQLAALDAAEEAAHAEAGDEKRLRIT
jgi:hypothetical protein